MSAALASLRTPRGLITGTATKLADQFFGKFAESVGAPPPATAPEAA